MYESLVLTSAQLGAQPMSQGANWVERLLMARAAREHVHEQVPRRTCRWSERWLERWLGCAEAFMRGRHIEGPISLVAEAVHVIVSVSRRRAGPLRRILDVHVRFRFA